MYVCMYASVRTLILFLTKIIETKDIIYLHILLFSFFQLSVLVNGCKISNTLLLFHNPIDLSYVKSSHKSLIFLF